MSRIYKYNLEMVDHQKIRMPLGATILSVQEQFGVLMFWAIVEERPLVFRKIHILGTGFKFDGSPGKYIGTAQAQSGAYVWHVFDMGEEI